MSDTTLANKYRPKKFADVIGQEEEVEVLKKILTDGWSVPAIMFTGPFGTGKTTLARLIARAILCDNRQGVEPCGTCPDCVAIDKDNHPSYIEVDAASQGAVADVRSLKDLISYKTGNKTKFLYFDESHMLSGAAQNAMLQTLEEGVKGVIFMFATTEANKMLPTVRSRCVELKMKLLRAAEIAARLRAVSELEGIKAEDKALRIISTYVRGHVRDALNFLGQLQRMCNPADGVTEQLVRTYLKLDQYTRVYEFLVITDRKQALTALEDLLCNYSVSELADAIGQVLLNAYKLKLGLNDHFAQLDEAWLKRVLETHQDTLLDKAEKILTLNTDFATINYGIAAIANIMIEGKQPNRSSGNGMQTQSSAFAPFRKPVKPAAPIEAVKS